MWFKKKKEEKVYPFSDILKDLLCDSAENKGKAAVLAIYFKDDKNMIEALKNASEDTLEQLAFEIARKDVVTPDDIEWLDKISKDFKKKSYGGIETSRDILEKAVGTQKTIDIINRLTCSLQVTPFEFIKKAYPKHLANILKNEMNQTIAVVCSYIGEEEAANLLKYLSDNQRTEVLLKISSMNRVSPDVLREVERVIERKLSTLASEDFANAGGVEYSEEIKKYMNKKEK